MTGGARRVGRAIVLELTRAGYDIALHFRSSREDARRTASEVRALQHRCALIEADLADDTSWARIIDTVVAEFGRLDVLVNNASLFDSRPRMKRSQGAKGFDAAEWDRLFRVNATAVAGLCHMAHAYLEAGGQGRIINLGDISAERPWPGYVSYCASKAALTAITQGLAVAYAPGITVNCIAPGIAIFPGEYSTDLRKKLVDKVPLHRPGTPEEIAVLVRFLVQDGGYITGQTIRVDGGRSLV